MVFSTSFSPNKTGTFFISSMERCWTPGGVLRILLLLLLLVTTTSCIWLLVGTYSCSARYLRQIQGHGVDGITGEGYDHRIFTFGDRDGIKSIRIGDHSQPGMIQEPMVAPLRVSPDRLSLMVPETEKLCFSWHRAPGGAGLQTGRTVVSFLP